MIGLWELLIIGVVVLVVGVIVFALSRRTSQSATARQIAAYEQIPPPPIRLDPATYDEIRTLLDNGQKIQAIRRYREVTHAGLREAKDAVEALEAGALAMPPALDPALEHDIRATLQAGDALLQESKRDAVAYYRDRTGGSEEEARQVVEAVYTALLRDETQAALPTASSVDQQIVALLHAGRKIDAIRRYREHSGKGLKESKEYVEALEAQMRDA
jgi:ribosomal protein L7/L12